MARRVLAGADPGIGVPITFLPGAGGRGSFWSLDDLQRWTLSHLVAA